MRCSTKNDEKGNAMVEFALLLPLYLFIFLGVYYVGHAVLTRLDVRSASRTFAENRGGWPLAENLQNIFDEGLFNLLIKDFYSADNLDLNDETGWGGGDAMASDYVQTMVTVPLDGTLAWDVARALRANNRYDPDRGYNIGSHFSRYGAKADSDVAMLECSDTDGSGFEGYASVFWQWVTIEAHYNNTRGGGPGFGARLDEGTIYRHLMEVNITNYEQDDNWGCFDPGNYNGRMPYDNYRQLYPSDYVVGPRHSNFPPPEEPPPYFDD